MARPTKYRKDYHPKSIIELSQQGLTRAEICCHWSISRDTLNQWSKDPNKPEMSDAVKRADDAREAYYVRLLRDMSLGKVPKGNITALIWLTKNTLKWGQDQNSFEPTLIQLAYKLD